MGKANEVKPEGKALSEVEKHNQKVSETLKALVAVKSDLEDLGANELGLDVLEAVNADIIESLYKSERPKKKATVEGVTDKEKSQIMAEMIEQIENTVEEIWADSYQKEDMKVSLAELSRIFNGTAGN